MTKTEQRIALCEWAGWKDVYKTFYPDIKPASPESVGWSNKTGDLTCAALYPLPDTNSLDVLHEMEKKLDEEQRTGYLVRLAKITKDETGRVGPTFATAAQRREALLRTLGLWKEKGEGCGAIINAARCADWMQVVLNQGPPCFYLCDDGDFCLRAESWDGHKTIGGSGPIHEYVSLEGLLRSIAPSEIKTADGSELLACPFCAGPAEFETIDGMFGSRKSVGCSTEGCQGYQSFATFATRSEATAAWNRRAKPVPAHKAD